MQDSIGLHVKQITTIKLPFIFKQVSRTEQIQNALKTQQDRITILVCHTQHTNNFSTVYMSTSILIELNQQLNIQSALFTCSHPR